MKSCMASDRNHAHLIRLQSTTHGEVSRPPLLWIGNRAWIRLKSIVATATFQLMKIEWETYLGALLHLNTVLMPRISAHPPILAQCKVHCLWALFCSKIYYDVCTKSPNFQYYLYLHGQDSWSVAKNTIHLEALIDDHIRPHKLDC